jgi:hypothetical protein
MLPNKLPAVDAAVTILFNVEHHWRGTTEAERWAVAMALPQLVESTIKSVCAFRQAPTTRRQL